MKVEDAKKLREPFDAKQIGKLPKPTHKDNPKGKCDVCGGWHGLPAVHLDYVGHAAVTDRLLQVDPEWTWEPMATGPNGEPLIVNGGLWIKLTIAGHTRPGYGDGGSVKEMIGDAIRNAAMRFGVALDLWAKEDIHTDDAPAKPKAKAPRGDGLISEPQRKRMWAIAKEKGVTQDRVRELVKEIAEVDSTADISKAKYDDLIAAIDTEDIPF